jgi:alpha-1,2-mannosyltransferase
VTAALRPGRIDTRRLAEIVLFGVLPLALPIGLIRALVTGNYAHHAFHDFRVVWLAGGDVAHGRSPYPFVYPAPIAVVAAPFGALPFAVAAAIFSAILLAAIVLALRLLGVRDWRCYGLAFMSMSATTGVLIGTLSPLLALGAAVAWRYRNRAWIVGAAIAAMIVAKLFLWPLAIWLLATRRFRATAATAVVAVSVLFLGWAVIGFAGLRSYPSLLHSIAKTEQYRGYSTVALAHALGFSSAGERAVLLCVAIALVLLVVVTARSRDGDRRAFALAVLGSLLVSPIVWMHYLVLLLVPIALASPTLTPLWFLPLATWILDNGPSDGVLWRIVVALAIVAGCLAVTVSRIGMMRRRLPAPVT